MLMVTLTIIEILSGGEKETTFFVRREIIIQGIHEKSYHIFDRVALNFESNIHYPRIILNIINSFTILLHCCSAPSGSSGETLSADTRATQEREAQEREDEALARALHDSQRTAAREQARTHTRPQTTAPSEQNHSCAIQ